MTAARRTGAIALLLVLTALLLPGLAGSAAAATAAAPALPVAVTVPGAPDPAPGPGDTTTSTSTAPAATVPKPAGPVGPVGPAGPSSVTIDVGGITGKPSQSIIVLLALTVLSIAPALLVLTTSFTKMVVVLSLTRNALGLQNVPPNQVLAGLAFFLSLVVMGPVLGKVNDAGLQPYLHGTKTQTQAWNDGTAPLKTWMLRQTRRADIATITQVSKKERPANAADVPLTTLVPSFVLSELRAAFIIGFVVFVPFLVIDLVVSSSLMSLGMMMVPPVLVSLPFKLLLFVLVDGWALITSSLVASYR